MRRTRRKFRPELKQEAVELVRQTGRSETQVARELGIASNVLNRWVHPARALGFLDGESLSDSGRSAAITPGSGTTTNGARYLKKRLLHGTARSPWP